MKVLYIVRIAPQETGGTKRAFEVLKRVSKYGVEPYFIQPSASKVVLLSKIGALTSLQMILSVSDFWDESIVHDLDLIVSVSESPETAIPAYLLHRKSRVPWTAIVQSPMVFRYTPSSTTSILIDPLWSPQQLLVSQTLRNTVPLAVSKAAIMQSTIRLKEFIELKTPVGVDWEIIRQTGPSSETYDALYLTRLVPGKGLFDIVEIWKKVVREKEDAKLVVAGNFGEEGIKRKFFQLIENAGLGRNIEYRGHVFGEKKFSLMKGAKVFVYPSKLDCFPIVILEALACGIPAIAYDIPGITFNYRTASVKTVPKNDTNAFAKKAIAIISMNRASERLSEISEKFASGFTWDNAAKEEVKAYMRLIQVLGRRKKHIV